MNESDVENYLVKKAKEADFLIRKCQWIGANHCPDRLVMSVALTAWVEVKAPGEQSSPGQAREHSRMIKHGQIVFIVDSKEQVDKLIESMLEANKQFKGIMNAE